MYQVLDNLLNSSDTGIVLKINAYFHLWVPPLKFCICFFAAATQHNILVVTDVMMLNTRNRSSVQFHVLNDAQKKKFHVNVSSVCSFNLLCKTFCRQVYERGLLKKMSNRLNKNNLPSFWSWIVWMNTENFYSMRILNIDWPIILELEVQMLQDVMF